MSRNDFRFHCFFADSRFVTSASQIAEMLKKKMQVFFAENRDLFNERTTLRIYYDAGQKSVTRILDAIPENCQCAVEMVQGVRQESCRMLQVADFICTVNLIGHRLKEGLPFNSSEKRFFGSPRIFERNILRKIKSKEI